MAGAPPNSKAWEIMGSSLRCATGTGMVGSCAGSRLKKASRSWPSCTDSTAHGSVMPMN